MRLLWTYCLRQIFYSRLVESMHVDTVYSKGPLQSVHHEVSRGSYVPSQTIGTSPEIFA